MPIELQVNYGMIRQINKPTSDTVPDNKLGAGVNYYILRNGVKVQLEVARIWYENTMDKTKDDTRVRAQSSSCCSSSAGELTRYGCAVHEQAAAE